jgi:hypothetical protein
MAPFAYWMRKENVRCNNYFEYSENLVLDCFVRLGLSGEEGLSGAVERKTGLSGAL